MSDELTRLKLEMAGELTRLRMKLEHVTKERDLALKALGFDSYEEARRTIVSRLRAQNAVASASGGGLPGAPPGPVRAPTGQGAVKPDIRGDKR